MLSHYPQLRKANHVNEQARDGDFNHLNNPDLTAGCRHWQGQQHLRARWGGNWSSFAQNKTTLMKNRNGVSVWLLSLSSYLIILKPSPYLGEEQEGCSGWSLEKLTELTQKHQLNQASSENANQLVMQNQAGPHHVANWYSDSLNVFIIFIWSLHSHSSQSLLFRLFELQYFLCTLLFGKMKYTVDFKLNSNLIHVKRKS